MDSPDAVDDFDGCSRRCRKAGTHTFKWGDCEHGVRPEPRLGFFRTATGVDGHLYAYEADIPLAAVLPWVKHMTVDQRWTMLEEISDAYDPAEAVQRWYRHVIPALQAECERNEQEGWDAFMRHEAAKRGEAHG
jgi:hypothetical protein